MIKENEKIIELSKFALGEIYFKKEGKVKSTKINRVGYLIIENDEAFIYDLVDNVVIDLYNQQNIEKSDDETHLFSIVNMPWENSDKRISPKELDETIEILKKRASEYDEEKRTTTKYVKREQDRNEVNSEYDFVLSKKSAHQKRLINNRIKKDQKQYV